MVCQKCESLRILCVSAKCSDLCYVSFFGAVHDGYVPFDLGDYIEIKVCMNCGQLQGDWPVASVFSKLMENE